MKKLTIVVSGLVIALGIGLSVSVADMAYGQKRNSHDLIAQAGQRASQNGKNATDKAVQIQNTANEKSVQVRREVCEQKRLRLERTPVMMRQGAESVKSSLDKMYDKVVAFYDGGQLTVEDFSSYIERIESAKHESATSIEALQTRENADLDCMEAGVANRLEADRLAGEEVKTALKQYRTELVDLINSMNNAKTEGE